MDILSVKNSVGDFIINNFFPLVVNNSYVDIFIVIFTLVTIVMTIVESFAEKKKLPVFIKSAIAVVILFLFYGFTKSFILALLIMGIYLGIVSFLSSRRRETEIESNVAGKLGESQREYGDFLKGTREQITVREKMSKSLKLAERSLDENRPKEAIKYLNNCKDKIKKQSRYFMLYAKALMMLSNYTGAFVKLNAIPPGKKKYRKKVLGLKIICHEKLGEYQKALEDYNRAINITHDAGELYFYRACLKIKILEISEYVNSAREIVNDSGGQDDFIRSVLEDCSHSVKEWYYETECDAYKGICHFYMGEEETAIELFQRSNEKRDDIYYNYLYFGIYHFNRKNYEAARNYLKKSIELNAKDDKAYYYLAQIYYEEKDYNPAIEAAANSLSIFPYRDDCYYIEAKCYMEMNMYEEAITKLTYAINLKPLAKYYKSRSMCYYNKKNRDMQKAYDDRKKCLEKEDNPYNRVKVICYGITLGVIPEEKIEEQIQPYKDNPEYYGDLGNAFFNRDKLEQAAYYYRKSLEYEESSVIYYNLALVLKKSGSVDEAILNLEKAHKLDAYYIKTCRELAEVYEMKGDFAKAAEAQLKVSQLNKTYLKINKRNGDDAYDIGQYQSAVDYYNRALSYDEDDVATINNMACAHYSLYRYEKAMELWKELTDIHKKYAPAYYNMANGYLCLNNSEEARKYYQKTLKLKPDYEPAREMLDSLDCGRILLWVDREI